jgi:hypothetical protein
MRIAVDRSEPLAALAKQAHRKCVRGIAGVDGNWTGIPQINPELRGC